MQHSDYDNFQAEDFLTDDDFIEWMLHPARAVSFWEVCKAKQPSKLDEFEKAISLFHALRRSNDVLSADEKASLKQKIFSQVYQSRQPRVVFRPWLKVAASIVMLLMASISVYYFAYGREVRVETAYGDRQQIVLPDASDVTLNGNSSLRYAADFNGAPLREVWLEGEAFFKVTKSKSKKFIVHTRELDIEVLGTSFNVDDREDVTKVVLNTGSITVSLNGAADADKIYLSPGEMIAYEKTNARVVKQVVNPETYMSWTHNAFHFDRMPVDDIAQILKERYGYEITIADSTLAKKLFTGRFEAADVDIVVAAMEKALSMKVVHEGKKKMIWRLN